MTLAEFGTCGTLPHHHLSQYQVGTCGTLPHQYLFVWYTGKPIPACSASFAFGFLNCAHSHTAFCVCRTVLQHVRIKAWENCVTVHLLPVSYLPFGVLGSLSLVWTEGSNKYKYKGTTPRFSRYLLSYRDQHEAVHPGGSVRAQCGPAQPPPQAWQASHRPPVWVALGRHRSWVWAILGSQRLWWSSGKSDAWLNSN